MNTICVSSKLAAFSISLKVKLAVLLSGVLRVDTGVMLGEVGLAGEGDHGVNTLVLVVDGISQTILLLS